MKNIIVLLLCFAFSYSLSGQGSTWDSYQSQYTTGPGLVNLRMDLKGYAPVEKYPILLVVNVSFETTDANRLPNEQTFNKLDNISKSIVNELDKTNDFIYAGNFLHDGVSRDFFYLTHESNSKQEIADLLKRDFASMEYTIDISEDKEWDQYLNFLFPSDGILNLMANRYIIEDLILQGDKLDSLHTITYTSYFKNEADLNAFGEKLFEYNFEVGSVTENNDDQYPIKLTFSRKEMIVLEELTDITAALQKMVVENNGIYDGWVTQAILEN